MKQVEVKTLPHGSVSEILTLASYYLLFSFWIQKIQSYFYRDFY